jgi:hypothetical protein
MTRMFTRLCLLATITMSVASASAQVIYEPVQYQYGDQNKFYYGGTDPRVFARAAAPSDPGAAWGRMNGYEFASGDTWVHREVSDQPIRVYSDALPTQIASVYGFTATDAANVANASVPRFFRKADVLAVARQTPGILIVPARAVFIPATAKPKATTQPLIILPSAILPAPAPPASDKLVLASH